MITYTSTPQEVFNEMCLVNNAMRGVTAKAYVTYNTFVKQNKRPIVKLLKYQVTTINYNKVHIWLIGVRVGNRNIIYTSYAVEYPNKNGRPRYLSFIIGDKKTDYTLILYTHHFCERLKERIGKTFIEWIGENTYVDCFGISDEINEKHDVIGIINNTFCIGVKEGQNIVRMITCVSKEQEFADQNMIHTKAKEALNAWNRFRGLKEVV